jgi:hypothetical protein
VQAEAVHRVEIENATELHKGHQTFVFDILVEFSLYLSFPRNRRLMSPDSDSSYVQVVKINVENIIHGYKCAIGNSVRKMLVISRTRSCEKAGRHRYVILEKSTAPQTHCILTHKDVMGMLVLSLLISIACVVSITTRWHTSTSTALLLVQITFCVLACPALTLAVRLPPSVFLGEYTTTTSTSLALKGIFLVLAIETILLFWIFI